jgi:hypothetical protein
VAAIDQKKGKKQKSRDSKEEINQNTLIQTDWQGRIFRLYNQKYFAIVFSYLGIFQFFS